MNTCITGLAVDNCKVDENLQLLKSEKMEKRLKIEGPDMLNCNA